MLIYISLCITAYLVIKILRAPRGADALGYLLVSGLMPLPVYMIGHDVYSGVMPVDVCLLAYIVVHGWHACYHNLERKGLSPGLLALFGFAVLATCSGVFNFYFVDPDPVKFYAYTTVRFWEYALLAMFLIVSRLDAAQLRKICGILIAGILVYEVLHALHISGIVPLSGKEYFGPGSNNIVGAADFSDRTGWFLTSYRVVVGGTASISAFFSLMVFEAYQGPIKVAAAIAAILSVFSVLATSSRSDIAGLAVAAIVFAMYAPPRRWKAYLCVAIAIAGLYGAFLAFSLPSGKETNAIDRVSVLWNSELRAESDYAVRSHDRAAMLKYLPEHPRDLLIGAGPGNFHWYQTQGITENYFGHNSYLHWTGELGIGGLILLLAWCLSICMYGIKRLRSQDRICKLAARTCLAVVASRMLAAWGAESLFGTQGMGYYSLFFVGVVYLLASVASDEGAKGAAFTCDTIGLRESTE